MEYKTSFVNCVLTQPACMQTVWPIQLISLQWLEGRGPREYLAPCHAPNNFSVKNGQNRMHSDFRIGFLNIGHSPGLLLIVGSNGPGRGRKGKRATDQWTRWTWTHSPPTTATAPPLPPLPLPAAPSATPAAAARPASAFALTFPPPLDLPTSTTVVILHHPHVLRRNPLSKLPLLMR